MSATIDRVLLYVVEQTGHVRLYIDGGLSARYADWRAVAWDHHYCAPAPHHQRDTDLIRVEIDIERG